jgi:hypothetical protein
VSEKIVPAADKLCLMMATMLAFEKAYGTEPFVAWSDELLAKKLEAFWRDPANRTAILDEGLKAAEMTGLMATKQ